VRKAKIFFLFLFIIFSATRTNIALAMNDQNDAPQGTFGNWKKKVTWIVASLAAQLILKEILVPIIKKIYGNDLIERAKIRSLIKINQALKQQLDYIKRNCRNKAVIRQMEEKYLASCIKVMELQKEYLDTYEKQQK